MLKFEGTLHQLRPPHRCFLCEEANDEEYVDVLREFSADVPHRLNGHKYVCAGCVEEMAKLLGYERSDTVKKATDAIEAMNQRYVALAATVRGVLPQIEQERNMLPAPEAIQVKRRRPSLESGA